MADAAESAMPRIMIPANAVRGSGVTAPVRVAVLLLPNCGRSRLDGSETSRRELIGVVVIEDSQMGTAMPVSREKWLTKRTPASRPSVKDIMNL